jgi:hypothetical protein
MHSVTELQPGLIAGKRASPTGVQGGWWPAGCYGFRRVAARQGGVRAGGLRRGQ